MVDVGRREDRMLDIISSQKRRIDATLLNLDLWRREYPDLAVVFDDIERTLSLDPALAD